MISHVDEPAGREADVCVVGAGPAGVEVARRLVDAGLRVILAEGGLERFDLAAQRLHAVDVVGAPIEPGGYDFDASGQTEYAGLARVRQLGGTTNCWSGKWKPLVPQDFVERAWVPHSGWPVGIDELLPAYRDIAARYGVPLDVATLTARRPRSLPEELAWHVHFEERRPYRVREREIDWLRREGRLAVLLGAQVQRLELASDGRHVVAATGRSLSGKPFSLRARAFVLAAGGWEVARILLSSGGSKGLGNAGGWLGRGYMDHPKIMCGSLRPTLRYLGVFRALVWRAGGRDVCRGALSLSPVEMAAARVPNHNTYLVARPGGAKANAASSARGLLRRAVRKGVGAAVYRGLRLATHYDMFHFFEQTPTFESRVYLGDGLDALGHPRLAVDWRFQDVDDEGIHRYLRRLKAILEARGIAQVTLPDRLPTMAEARCANHHMGVTRMASDARRGVVDRNCRVFGTDNAFVASSAVFPTGGNANPTLTILALAHRLGGHLSQALKADGLNAGDTALPLPEHMIDSERMDRRSMTKEADR